MTTHTITVGRDAQNRIVVRPATNSPVDVALAKAAAEMLPDMLNGHARRQQIAKELDGQAAIWQSKANAQAAPSSELGTYYRGKAADARRLAKSIREGTK